MTHAEQTRAEQTHAEQTRAEQAKAGRALREAVPRRDQGTYRASGRDAVAILSGQHEGRLEDLVPLRVGRMLESPFAFLRGAAAIMAADLAGAPVSGPRVLACGDAHLANFGFFASPERRLLFDLNDFDEAFPAPWEWELKRLAASAWVMGRTNGYSEARCREAAEGAAREYRETIRELHRKTAVERFYFQVETDLLASARRSGFLSGDARKARRRDSEQVLSQIGTRTEDGSLRIVDQPPIMRHPDVLAIDYLEELYASYRRTLRPDASLLLSQYRLADYALRVVGVGSIGLRSWIVLLEGPTGDPFVLQAKEARPSVLQTHGGLTVPPGFVAADLAFHGQGYRVVGSQRVLQAQSDTFLGWIRDTRSQGDAPRDYYLRQFRDMKGTVNLTRLSSDHALRYAKLCGRLLARAHTQSPGSGAIAGYLGRSPAADAAIARWARAYADQTEADLAALAKAVKSGRVAAERQGDRGD